MAAFDRCALETDKALALAPTADDVWFWGAAVATRTPRYCTGEEFGIPNGLESLSRSLNSQNVFGGRNDVAIANVVAYFGLGPTPRDY